MLNEAPNNNDVTHVENMALNEAPNSNDATRVANNVHLTTMGVHNNSQWQLYIMQKSQLTRDER